MKSSGPGGIRIRDPFSAVDGQVGEKGEKAVYYVYDVSKSPYCFSQTVPKLYPLCTRGMKQGKVTRNPVLRGEK